MHIYTKKKYYTHTHAHTHTHTQCDVRRATCELVPFATDATVLVKWFDDVKQQNHMRLSKNKIYQNKIFDKFSSQNVNF